MPATAPQELDYQLTVGDLAGFQYFHTLRKVWWLLPVALVLCVIAVVSVAQASDRVTALLNALPLVLLVAFWLVFILGVPYFSAWRQVATSKSIVGPHHITFTESDMHSLSPTSTASVSWSIVHKICETRSAFLIYYSSRLAWILPKRAFVSAEHIERFRWFLQERTGSSKPIDIRFPGQWC